MSQETKPIGIPRTNLPPRQASVSQFAQTKPGGKFNSQVVKTNTIKFGIIKE